MRQELFASRIYIVVVLATFGAGRVFGGFTDTTRAAEISTPVALNEKVVATTTDEVASQKLTFDSSANAAEKRGDEQDKLIQPALTVPQSTEPAVTAPLPDALLPGILMIAATFVATRFFKRKLI